MLCIYFRNGLELQTAISNIISAGGQAQTSQSIAMIWWLVATMSNSPLTPGLGSLTTPWSCWSTYWSSSTERITIKEKRPSLHTSSTLLRTQPMPRHIQVTHHVIIFKVKRSKSYFLGKKFSNKSLRGTSYGDAVMEIDWAVGQILEYVNKKRRY